MSDLDISSLEIGSSSGTRAPTNSPISTPTEVQDKFNPVNYSYCDICVKCNKSKARCLCSYKVLNSEDILTTDPEIPSQKYFILSYIIPSNRNELTHTMFKFRGAFETIEQCEKKVNLLKISDPHINIFICESFKWGILLNDDELLEDKWNNLEYREGKMNDLFSGYKQSRQRALEEFEYRRHVMTTRAKFDGSKEGQELLAQQAENPFTIKHRVETIEPELNNLRSQVEELEKIYNASKDVLSKYTDEEIELARQEIEEQNKKMYNEEDIFLQRKRELMGQK